MAVCRSQIVEGVGTNLLPRFRSCVVAVGIRWARFLVVVVVVVVELVVGLLWLMMMTFEVAAVAVVELAVAVVVEFGIVLVVVLLLLSDATVWPILWMEKRLELKLEFGCR